MLLFICLSKHYDFHRNNSMGQEKEASQLFLDFMII